MAHVHVRWLLTTMASLIVAAGAITPSVPMSAERDNDSLRVAGGRCCGGDVGPLSRAMVDSSRPPVFEWKIAAPRDGERGVMQTAYTLELAVMGKTTWSSGIVSSNQSSNVVYSGPLPLSPHTYYQWFVTVWDNLGRVSQPFLGGEFLSSDPTIFETASWIGSQKIQMNELRKEFELSKKVSSAIAYIAGLGYYELLFNGQEVDPTRKLDPTWTYYEKHIIYNTFNVTSLLSTGSNCVGLRLGNGWYSQDQWISSKDHPQYGPPRLIFTLLVTFSDGTTKTISSDTTWTGRQSAIIYDSVYSGEHIDARLLRNSWASVPFIDKYSLWLSADKMDSPGGEYIPMQGPAIRTMTTELSPVSVKNPCLNTWVFDFGQNFVGWVRLNLRGPAGVTITIKYAETLEQLQDGIYTGMIYTDSLRAADQTDQYIMQGSTVSDEVFEPRFTYHGFRYVEVRGSWHDMTRLSITGVVVNTDATKVSSFSSSDPVINQIHSNTVWGQQGNLMGIPTPCTQRDERDGWTGDTHCSSDEAIFNFDLHTFWSNWLLQIKNAQATDGSIPDTVPYQNGKTVADPFWGAVLPSLVYLIADHYGDLETAEEYYDVAKNWVDFLVTQANATGLGKMYYNYGDWEPPPPYTTTNQSLCSSFALELGLQQISGIAALLNKESDSEYYAALYDSFAKEFHDAFYNQSIKGYAEGKQTANILALSLPGVVPSELQSDIVTSLISDISAHGNHSTSGIIGIKYLFPLLSDLGYDSLALSIATQTDYPSYGYMFTNPYENATTLWEDWNAPFVGPRANSRNHIMFGSIDAWFYRYLAGINPNGLNEILIQPPRLRNSELKWVKAQYHTTKGLISVDWQWKSDDKYQISLTIPHNAKARLYTPNFPLLEVTEGGHLLWTTSSQTSTGVNGIHAIAKDPHGKLMIQLGSGIYNFEFHFNMAAYQPPTVPTNIQHNTAFTEYIAAVFEWAVERLPVGISDRNTQQGPVVMRIMCEGLAEKLTESEVTVGLMLRVTRELGDPPWGRTSEQLDEMAVKWVSFCVSPLRGVTSVRECGKPGGRPLCGKGDWWASSEAWDVYLMKGRITDKWLTLTVRPQSQLNGSVELPVSVVTAEYCSRGMYLCESLQNQGVMMLCKRDDGCDAVLLVWDVLQSYRSRHLSVTHTFEAKFPNVSRSNDLVLEYALVMHRREGSCVLIVGIVESEMSGVYELERGTGGPVLLQPPQSNSGITQINDYLFCVCLGRSNVRIWDASVSPSRVIREFPLHGQFWLKPGFLVHLDPRTGLELQEASTGQSVLHIEALSPTPGSMDIIDINWHNCF
ncbi:family 78 glycoside hydrolase catalytic domain [Pelomyxa schiedti]|nr:family 78 glycoside hydrolase catalytic domain [Pelomyxa schiedti]